MSVRAVVSAVAVTSVLLAGCGDSDSDSGSDSTSSSTSASASTGAPAETSTTTTPVAERLRILVTNDDGYDAEGIDVLVEALRRLPDVEITVVAPATNQSGTGSQVTPGAVTATRRKTRSGYRATAVEGFPADAVAYGLSEAVAETPHLVVAGINQGQNLGPLTAISGTVGAAKAATAAGVPALAASQGLADAPDYASAADLIVEWVVARRDVLIAGTAAVDIVSLNVPTCPVGTVRGLRQLPLGETAASLAIPSDCTSTATAFTDDGEAFAAGFATATELTPAGEPVATSTTWPAAG